MWRLVSGLMSISMGHKKAECPCWKCSPGKGERDLWLVGSGRLTARFGHPSIQTTSTPLILCRVWRRGILPVALATAIKPGERYGIYLAL